MHIVHESRVLSLCLWRYSAVLVLNVKLRNTHPLLVHHNNISRVASSPVIVVESKRVWRGKYTFSGFHLKRRHGHAAAVAGCLWLRSVGTLCGIE